MPKIIKYYLGEEQVLRNVDTFELAEDYLPTMKPHQYFSHTTAAMALSVVAMGVGFFI